MSVLDFRAKSERVLTGLLGAYTDTTTDPPEKVGPAFWLGADVPAAYRITGLEAILQFAGFEKDRDEFEDAGLQGTALYRLTLIQHDSGASVDEALYRVLEAFPTAEPQPVVPESDLTLESTSVLLKERINRPPQP